jgi:hypothetical protein
VLTTWRQTKLATASVPRAEGNCVLYMVLGITNVAHALVPLRKGIILWCACHLPIGRGRSMSSLSANLMVLFVCSSIAMLKWTGSNAGFAWMQLWHLLASTWAPATTCVAQHRHCTCLQAFVHPTL